MKGVYALTEDIKKEDVKEEEVAQTTEEVVEAVSYTHLDVYKRQV